MTTDEERAERLEAIIRARASCRLEGIILPEAIEKIGRRFIDGEISPEDFVALALQAAQAPKDPPPSGTPTQLEVGALAKRHGVRYVKTSVDAWGKKLTELCGDDVKDDATADLLLALNRAGIIIKGKMLDLLAAHLREQKGRG